MSKKNDASSKDRAGSPRSAENQKPIGILPPISREKDFVSDENENNENDYNQSNMATPSSGKSQKSDVDLNETFIGPDDSISEPCAGLNSRKGVKPKPRNVDKSILSESLNISGSSEAEYDFSPQKVAESPLVHEKRTSPNANVKSRGNVKDSDPSLSEKSIANEKNKEKAKEKEKEKQVQTAAEKLDSEEKRRKDMKKDQRAAADDLENEKNEKNKEKSGDKLVGKKDSGGDRFESRENETKKNDKATKKDKVVSASPKRSKNEKGKKGNVSDDDRKGDEEDESVDIEKKYETRESDSSKRKSDKNEKHKEETHEEDADDSSPVKKRRGNDKTIKMKHKEKEESDCEKEEEESKKEKHKKSKSKKSKKPKDDDARASSSDSETEDDKEQEKDKSDSETDSGDDKRSKKRKRALDGLGLSEYEEKPEKQRKKEKRRLEKMVRKEREEKKEKRMEARRQAMKERERQIKKQAKLWKVKHICWGRVYGHPYWPGYIDEVVREKGKRTLFKVIFFGRKRSHAYLTAADMEVFNPDDKDSIDVDKLTSSEFANSKQKHIRLLQSRLKNPETKKELKIAIKEAVRLGAEAVSDESDSD